MASKAEARFWWLRKYGNLDTCRKDQKTREGTSRLEAENQGSQYDDRYLRQAIWHADPKKVYPQTIRQLQEERLSLSKICRLFGISRQSVYQQRQRICVREKELQKVKQFIEQVRLEQPRTGTRKLYYLLKNKFRLENIKIGRDALFDYLRRENLLIYPKKRYTRTTFCKHWLRKHPNLLKTIDLKRKEQVFVSDITYVKTNTNVSYLSLVTDAYSRKIMGYELSENMKVKALKMAVRNRITHLPLIHHSDRGLQYCSEIYQKALGENRITPSITRI